MPLRLLAMLIYTPVACVVAVVAPYLGLLALVVMYYFRPSIWESPEWFRPVFFLTAAVGLGWALRARTLRFTPLMGLSLVVLLMLLLSAVQAKASVDDGVAMVWVVAKIMVVQFLVLQLCDTPRKINGFLWANVAGMLWNVKTIMVKGLRGGDLESVGRVDVGVGQGGGANYLAMVLVMTLPFFFVKFLHGSRRERRAAVVLTPFYLLSVIFCGSRGGFLALFLTGMYMMFRTQRKALGTAVAAAGMLLVVLLIPQTQWERLEKGLGAEGRRDFAARSRLLLWEAGWDMFKDYPVLGVGPDNFQHLSPAYAGFYASKTFDPYEPGVDKPGFVAHSTWVQTVAEGGLLVSVPFFLLFFLAWRNLVGVRRLPIRDPDLKRRLDGHSLALEGLFVAFIIASTFGSHMKIDFLWWYLGLVGALQLVAQDAALREWRRAPATPHGPSRTRERIPVTR